MNLASPITSLRSLLDVRAGETPDKLAYLYLGDPGGPLQCTYGQLQQRANEIARRIVERGQPGQRVLLLYPPGLDFLYAFLGCMSGGAIAVPAPPPNPLKPQRSLARLQSIVRSAKPTYALTTAAMLEAIRPAIAESDLFAQIQWLATDDAGDGVPSSLSVPQMPDSSGPETIALIQYTSGSTADPKGAALSHGNVLHNISYFNDGWAHTRESIQVNWLPAFHDLGLLYGVLTPLWGNFLGIQMSPIDVIQKPFVWLKAISDYRATHSTGPNFIYELCNRKITDAQLATLDLRSWRMALTAAEPIRAETMSRFAARFAGAGFVSRTFSPGYGLSEGTCKVTAVPCEEEAVILHLRDDQLEQNRVEIVAPGSSGTRAVVGCGRPSHGVGVVIVDPETCMPRAAGQVGEIWLTGPSIASSYWEQPAATEAVLRARLVGSGDMPHLRTGDLGFLHDGQLYITGRIKDMIVVRGCNHYPQDLEYTAQDASASIRPGCCAAFSYEEDGEERVAMVAEVDRGQGSGTEVIETVRMAIAEHHGLRVHRLELVEAGTIPKTTSGKIQRQACKTAMLSGRLARVA